MHNETDEDILRELETYTPDLNKDMAGTLRTLARLAELIKDDVEGLLDSSEDERIRSVREVERKVDVLTNWLQDKADQCRE